MVEKLTAEQIAEFKAAFNLFDKDDNGAITMDHYREVIRYLGPDLTKTEFEDIYNIVYCEGCPSIDFPEFLTVAMMARRMYYKTEDEDELIENFKVFDKDGNGIISAADLRQVLKNSGIQSDDSVEEMIREADIDGDGQKINYEEFFRMMVSK